MITEGEQESESGQGCGNYAESKYQRLRQDGFFLISIEILQRSGTNTVRSAAVSARKKVDQLTEIRFFSIGVLSVP
ncbi:hypothetical protein QJ036_13475 [Ruminococcus sp. YH-rum2234]|uniref:Uncharacterized protein n=1 Tax=Fusibacillus kribbianus TaxID=3044208 RepID=A0AAP4BD21_9FIRM|nr:hypothetical protein [Ruminococcus sp. YH-rum2234]